MALQTSGAISLANIQTEFGGSNPISLNEYYGAASGIPASGAIDFADFYGKSSGPTANTGGRYIANSNSRMNITNDSILFMTGSNAASHTSPPNTGSAPAVWYVASTNGSYVYRCIGWATTAVDKFIASNLVFERLSGAPLPTGVSGTFVMDYNSSVNEGALETTTYSPPAARQTANAPHSSKYFCIKSMTNTFSTGQNTVPLFGLDILIYNSTLTFNT